MCEPTAAQSSVRRVGMWKRDSSIVERQRAIQETNFNNIPFGIIIVICNIILVAQLVLKTYICAHVSCARHIQGPVVVVVVAGLPRKSSANYMLWMFGTTSSAHFSMPFLFVCVRCSFQLHARIRVEALSVSSVCAALLSQPMTSLRRQCNECASRGNIFLLWIYTTYFVSMLFRRICLPSSRLSGCVGAHSFFACARIIHFSSALRSLAMLLLSDIFR